MPLVKKSETTPSHATKLQLLNESDILVQEDGSLNIKGKIYDVAYYKSKDDQPMLLTGKNVQEGKKIGEIYKEILINSKSIITSDKNVDLSNYKYEISYALNPQNHENLLITETIKLVIRDNNTNKSSIHVLKLQNKLVESSNEIKKIYDKINKLLNEILFNKELCEISKKSKTLEDQSTSDRKGINIRLIKDDDDDDVEAPIIEEATNDEEMIDEEMIDEQLENVEFIQSEKFHPLEAQLRNIHNKKDINNFIKNLNIEQQKMILGIIGYHFNSRKIFHCRKDYSHKTLVLKGEKYLENNEITVEKAIEITTKIQENTEKWLYVDKKKKSNSLFTTTIQIPNK